MEIDYSVHADGTGEILSTQESDRQGLTRPHIHEENITDLDAGNDIENVNWSIIGRKGKIIEEGKNPIPRNETTSKQVLPRGNENQQERNQIRSNRVPVNSSSAPSGTFGKLTDYPNPDVADNQISTRLRRAVKASFTANRGPYVRDKFTKHLNDLGILEELETCGATAQRNTFILTFATIKAAEEFKRAGNFTTADGLFCSVNPNKDMSS
jgi:hypothetical protein